MITRKPIETWGAYCARCREAGEKPKTPEASYMEAEAKKNAASAGEQQGQGETRPESPAAKAQEAEINVMAASPAPLSGSAWIESRLAVGLSVDEIEGLKYMRTEDLRLIGKAVAHGGTPDALSAENVNHALGRVALADDVLEKAPDRGAGEQV